QIDEPVDCEELEHVVEEGKSGLDACLPCAVKRQADLDVGLLGATRSTRGALGAHRPRSARTARNASRSRSFSAGPPIVARRATSCVSAPTLYGSRAASYIAATRRSATSAPSRRPAAACALENVRATTTFARSAIREMNERPENSA